MTATFTTSTKCQSTPPYNSSCATTKTPNESLFPLQSATNSIGKMLGAIKGDVMVTTLDQLKDDNQYNVLIMHKGKITSTIHTYNKGVFQATTAKTGNTPPQAASKLLYNQYTVILKVS